MRRLQIVLLLALGTLALPWALMAQSQPPPIQDITIEALPGGPEPGIGYDPSTGVLMATNGAMVRYGGAVLTANTLQVYVATLDVLADGQVRIQQGEQVWASEHVRYNFRTHQMEAQQFRTGKPPVFAEGAGLYGDTTNRVYYATNATLTTDDIAQPAFKLRAKRIRIVPNEKIEAWNATLYAGDVPVFYFPYYTRNLGVHANNFNFTPGYRSLYGPFILGTYTWYWGDDLDGALHLDYRQKRGVGLGPDVNYRFGPWGYGTLKYYYTHDDDSNVDGLGVPIPEDRQRVWFSYQANPATNLYVTSLVRYQSDLALTRDFFEGEYRQDPQPNTFFEVNKFWQNFSVDTYVEPRVNPFLQTVERLPDVKLTGYRQQLGATPLYYESESSLGYYRQLYAVDAGSNGPPPGLNYEAARADTFQQILLPETFFGWLNVTPRVGGRATYYGEASGPGAHTDELTRGVFNTGAEISFKASRVWPGIESKFFDVDSLRHIIQPSANYVFVPKPNAVGTNEIPQFDSELPSLRLLPIDFPQYNSIDSIDSQNVIRWGLRNKLQTKRDGQVVNLIDWDVYTDWRLKPNSGQTTFSDLYSDLTVKPASWLSWESLLRYDLSGLQWRMAYNTLVIQPNNTWSWRFGHYYLRDDFSPSPTALGAGNNVFNSTLNFRLNEDWGLRMAHYFNERTGKMQEQSYSVFRDMRSWTAALSFLIRQNTTGPQDYGVAFTFSFKAFPRFGLGHDAGGPYSLLGSGG